MLTNSVSNKAAPVPSPPRSPHTLSVLLANVRSYLPKKEAIEALLLDNNTEVAIFTESWLN